MVILVAYLTLKDLVSFLDLFINVIILFFQWVYFTSFLDHYIELNILFLFI